MQISNIVLSLLNLKKKQMFIREIITVIFINTLA